MTVESVKGVATQWYPRGYESSIRHERALYRLMASEVNSRFWLET